MFHAKQIASSVDAFALTNDANSVRATDRANTIVRSLRAYCFHASTGDCARSPPW